MRPRLGALADAVVGSRAYEKLGFRCLGDADAAPLYLDREMRRAIAFPQRVDLEIGRILRQILEGGLYRELGFERFEDYVVERLDLSPRPGKAALVWAGPGR